MTRSLSALLIVSLAGCAGAPEPESAFDPNILGRWDVTVTGPESYPLWFELSEEGGTLSGRLQARTGHARELESVEASGTLLMMSVAERTYHANFDGAAWKGTVESKDGVKEEWRAVRAPELPAPASPTWGEPIELFNGKDLTGWIPRDPEKPNRWKAEDGVLLNEESGTDLVTEATFENFKLHIEVNVPEGSNSGIYLRGRYEVQVLDDFVNEPLSRQMGAIYGQVTPVENAALPAGEWQSFDITLLGRFVTVVLNEKTVIDHREIPGITGGALDANEAEPGPIFLQGDHGRILYRNLVLTPTRN